MKVLKQFLDFYINTSIHVATAVFALVQITKLDLTISTNLCLDYFIFFGTVLGYNFLKYAKVFNNKIFTFHKNHSIVLVSLIAFVGVFFSFFQIEKTIQISFFKIGLLVAIYPFIRKFGFIKMIFVSFCLTLITVYILEINHSYWYLIKRYLLIFCLLIPLEICDLKSDSKTIKTLPRIIGIRNLKILGYCLLVIFCFLQISFSNLSFAFLVAVFIFFSDENRSNYYASFWVESLPIFWWISLFFTK